MPTLSLIQLEKLLLTHMILKKRFRDSYTNKRVDLAGSLLLELYRDCGLSKKLFTNH